jgi:hypothetical protein
MSAYEPDAASILKAYIEKLPGWKLSESEPPYDHMGAVICDAGLQAGINYQRVVYPRIELLLTQYPEARTTSGFLQLLGRHGAADLLSWSGTKKLQLISRLAEYFARCDIETTADLRAWLSEPHHLAELLTIKGIGPKTVNYIQILVGLQAVAVDIHLRLFVKQAGISAKADLQVGEIIGAAADLMKVDRALLDQSIWRYMSQPRVT